jgi:hypothetical protein
LKPLDSHIPWQLRQWLDRQIARELAVAHSNSMLGCDLAAGEEQAVHDRWLNARATACPNRLTGNNAARNA